MGMGQLALVLREAIPAKHFLTRVGYCGGWLVMMMCVSSVVGDFGGGDISSGLEAWASFRFVWVVKASGHLVGWHG